MPKLNIYPEPKKRFHGGRWRIYWKWNSRQYSIPTDYTDEKLSRIVDSDMRVISAALASDAPSFPDKYSSSKAVALYIADRLGQGVGKEGMSDEKEWLIDYEHEISGKNTKGWIRDTKTALKSLRNRFSSLDAISEKGAAEYMAEMAKSKKPGTHNKRLSMFKKFYSWLNNTKRHESNPFKTIKRLPEGKDTPIVYCTVKERDELIALAKSINNDGEWPEWIAVAIAFYTGMRREEIANLKWEDVRSVEGNVFIAKTKTMTSRALPLSTALEKILDEYSGKDKCGYVVKCPEGMDRIWRFSTLAKKLKKVKKEAIVKASCIEKPMPSRSKDYQDKKAEYLVAFGKIKEGIDKALERIGWNAWRHTFASLLVQSGVDIDTVSSWMGNTPEVCRRHYAQFIPRDRRDSRIDLL